MAKVIGESGFSAAEQAIRHFRRMLLCSLVAVSLVSMIAGYLVCITLHVKKLPASTTLIGVFLAAGAVFSISHFITRRMEMHERKRIDWRKGALGEAAVGLILESLPDSYIVFNDIGTRSSNIDHVVVGPTGIFVIDTKNWRGTVTADGQGELLANGRSSRRGEVKALLRSIATMREKINVLTRRDDFIQGILAFPLARVDARWGTTRNVHCITDDRIIDYIVNYNFSRRLKQEEVALIEKAFLALAGMGAQFDPAEGGLTVLRTAK